MILIFELKMKVNYGRAEMKIGILTRNPNLYSTGRLRQSALDRGHEVEIINFLKCYMIIKKGNPEIYYDGKKIAGLDAIIPRIGASKTFYGASIVRQFEMMKVFCVNESQAIARSRDKLRSMQLLSRAGIGMPITAFASHLTDVKHIISEVKNTPIVIKLLESTQGNGVVLAETSKAAKSVIKAFHSLKANVMVQEYVKEARGSDIRTLVVGGRVVAAMKRQGVKGEFRSNLHLGGNASPIKLKRSEKSTALKAAKILGLNVAGVDILQSPEGPMVIEVNSSPGLEGIEKCTGVDVGSKIIEFIEKSYEKRGMIRDKVNI